MHQASSEKPEAQDYSALIKTALREIERMEARLQEAERSRSAPIAVIGMGCRFPGGANNPEGYWNALLNGVNAIRAHRVSALAEYELRLSKLTARPGVPAPAS